MPAISTEPEAAALKVLGGDIASCNSFLYKRSGSNNLDGTSEEAMARVAPQHRAEYRPADFEVASQEQFAAKHYANYPFPSNVYPAGDEDSVKEDYTSELPENHLCSSNSLHRMECLSESPAYSLKTATPSNHSCLEYPRVGRNSISSTFNHTELPGENGAVIAGQISLQIGRELETRETSRSAFANSSSKRKLTSTFHTVSASSFKHGNDNGGFELKKVKTNHQIPIPMQANVLQGAAVRDINTNEIKTTNYDTMLQMSLAPNSTMLRQQVETSRPKGVHQKSDDEDVAAREKSNESHDAGLVQTPKTRVETSGTARAILEEELMNRSCDCIASTSRSDVSVLDSSISTLEAQTAAKLRDSQSCINGSAQIHMLTVPKDVQNDLSDQLSIKALIDCVDKNIKIGRARSPTETLTLRNNASTDLLLQALTRAEIAASEIDQNVSSGLPCASSLGASVSGTITSSDKLLSQNGCLEQCTRHLPPPVISPSVSSELLASASSSKGITADLKRNTPKDELALSSHCFSIPEKVSAGKEHLLILSDGSKLTFRAKFMS